MIGKYHPHGDQSVYDAMVRLAQDFSLRYPLVDGQGNFGNVDGDNAAAMRYTEARLTAAAGELMAGLDEGTVDFRPTYNGEEEEPEVFPGLFPNLLANGASGIAVGMATSIPPHNVAEIDRRRHPPDRQSAAPSRRGADGVRRRPRFPDRRRRSSTAPRRSPRPMRPAAAPSGCGRAGRSRRARRASWTAVVTEIPYQVPKAKLIEQIAALIADRKLPILADVRDESDEEIRIVIEPRSRTVDPQTADGQPVPADRPRSPRAAQPQRPRRQPHAAGDGPEGGAAASGSHFQIEVLVRRSQHRLAKIDDRLELLEGYLIAFLNLDRVIEIIRTEDEPKPVMIAEFALTDRQAEAILNMRLRSLRKLEEMQLRSERDELDEEREELDKLIESPARQRTRLKKDLTALRDALRAGDRARPAPHPDRGSRRRRARSRWRR